MAMVHKIHLNGGPWHDKTVTLPDNRDHFHILGRTPTPTTQIMSDDEIATSALPTREGTYSRISGVPGEFEWDGWVTHD